MSRIPFSRLSFSRVSVLLSSLAMPLVFAGGVVTATATPPTVAEAGVFSCEVKPAKRGGATVVEGFVSGPSGTVGAYRISVTSGGGDTDQSGEFVSSGSRVAVGAVPVAGSGNFSAEIQVKTNGVVRCSARTGGKA